MEFWAQQLSNGVFISVERHRENRRLDTTYQTCWIHFLSILQVAQPNRRAMILMGKQREGWSVSMQVGFFKFMIVCWLCACGCGNQYSLCQWMEQRCQSVFSLSDVVRPWNCTFVFLPLSGDVIWFPTHSCNVDPLLLLSIASLNFLNAAPCSGLVKKSPIISSVGQCSTVMSPEAILSCTKK